MKLIDRMKTAKVGNVPVETVALHGESATATIIRERDHLRALAAQNKDQITALLAANTELRELVKFLLSDRDRKTAVLVEAQRHLDGYRTNQQKLGESLQRLSARGDQTAQRAAEIVAP